MSALAAACVAVVLLVVIVLVRECSSSPEAPSHLDRVEPDGLAAALASASGLDALTPLERAGAGSLQTRAHALLDRDEQIGWVAAHATSPWSYAGLDANDSWDALVFAMRTPQATNFARTLPRTHGETQPWRSSLSKGQVPILYQWDERWAYTDYCGMPLGFSGCGVTVMAMARAGLTGQADLSPADIAWVAIDEREAFGGTNSTFFTESAGRLGLEGTRLRDSGAALTSSLKAGALVAVSVKPNTLAGGGHWVLAVGVNEDGTIRIHDPNSPANTARDWDVSELMGYENALVSLTAAGATN